MTTPERKADAIIALHTAIAKSLGVVLKPDREGLIKALGEKVEEHIDPSMSKSDIIKTEVDSGKPQKQAVAIAYSEKKESVETYLKDCLTIYETLKTEPPQ